MSQRILLVLLVGSLAACGGGSGDDEIVLPEAPPAYRALAVEAIDLGEKLDGYLDSSTLAIPPSSDAEFDGVLLVIDDADPDFGGYAGDLSVSYAFATETIDGEATGFFYDGNTDENVASIGEPVSGTMTIDGSTISAGIIDVTLAGSLDGASVNGTGGAGFAGPDGDMLIIEALDVTAAGRTTMTVRAIAD